MLSNRTGGHWYRIIGPNERNTSADNWGAPVFPLPMRSWRGSGPGDNRDRALPPILESIERSWAGPSHALPVNKVRFLALTDLDNGSYMKGGYYDGGIKRGDQYPVTYPRPWFGWYDAGSKRLYPWGGYDPLLQVQDSELTRADARDNEGDDVVRSRTVTGGKPISHTGFYYEGDDGTIAGCKNPFDRWIVNDNSPLRDGFYVWRNPDRVQYQDLPAGNPPLAPDSSNGYQLLKQGDARPLINARWLDFTFIFYPDGHVDQGPFLWMRSEFGDRKGINNSNIFKAKDKRMRWHGPGDMCNQSGEDYSEDGWDQNPRWNEFEATSYEARTGTWWVTLGPEDGNSDIFPDANAAMRSLMPACRVGINRFGDVRVIKVSNTLPSGTTFDTTLTGGDWNDGTKTDASWAEHLLIRRTGAKIEPLGMPAETFVTQEMLTGRSWWMTVPP